MTYRFEITKDEYAGLIVIEYLNKKPNCIWELNFVKNKIDMLNENHEDTSYSKHSINRCLNWLISNHAELLL
jgi:hypothetical protein